jgi:hypothetical protein
VRGIPHALERLSASPLWKAKVMIVATRNLVVRQPGQDVAVPVRVHAPVADGTAWTCEYEIVWPEETWSKQISGADSVQALRLALEAVGMALYFSHHHKSGCLIWPGASGGYGFPVPHNTRHLLIGDDAIFDG